MIRISGWLTGIAKVTLRATVALHFVLLAPFFPPANYQEKIARNLVFTNFRSFGL